MKTRHLLWLCTLYGGSLCMAQNSTNLPTSMYGIGELTTAEGGRLAGMGQTGIALNRTGFLNTQNPAAITRMDTTCFTFDVGATASYARYHFLSEQSSNFTGNPNRFVFGFRMMPLWYTTVGMTPYSSVGYLIRTEEPIEGTDGGYVSSTFEGSGGLYRLFLTNAVQLTPDLSVGASLGAIIGKATQSETQEGSTVEYESKKKTLYADFGLHYSWERSDKRTWEVGLVFSPSIGLGQDNNLSYSSSSTSETVDEDTRVHAQYLPMRIGAGVATSNERWTFTADYQYIDWSRNTSDYTSVDYENQHKFNLGALYVTQPRKPRSVELMSGIGLSNSYISLKGGKMYYAEVNAGASFPIGLSYLTLAVGWRRQLNSRADLMQESRLSFHLNLTFGEKIWKSKLQ